MTKGSLKSRRTHVSLKCKRARRKLRSIRRDSIKCLTRNSSLLESSIRQVKESTLRIRRCKVFMRRPLIRKVMTIRSLKRWHQQTLQLKNSMMKMAISSGRMMKKAARLRDPTMKKKENKSSPMIWKKSGIKMMAYLLRRQ